MLLVRRWSIVFDGSASIAMPLFRSAEDMAAYGCRGLCLALAHVMDWLRWNLQANCMPLRRQVLARCACACHEAGTAGGPSGQLHPSTSNFNGSLSHHLLLASDVNFGRSSILPHEVHDDGDLYPATSFINSKQGLCYSCNNGYNLRDHQPQPKCPPGMISVGCGVDEDRFARDLHPPKSIGCYWPPHDSTL